MLCRILRAALAIGVVSLIADRVDVAARQDAIAIKHLGTVTVPDPSKDETSGVDLRTREFLGLASARGVRGWNSLAPDPSSHRVYVGGFDGLFWIDLPTATLEGPLHPIRVVGDVEVAPELKTVFAQARDGDVVAISTDSGDQRWLGHVDDIGRQLQYDPARQELHVPFERGIAVFDAVTGERRPSLQYPKPPGYSIREQGSRIYQAAAGQPGRFHVLDLPTGDIDQLELENIEHPVGALVMDDHGRAILAHGRGVSLFDLATGRQLAHLDVPAPQTLVFDATSRVAIAAWPYSTGTTRLGLFRVAGDELLEHSWHDLPRGAHRLLVADGGFVVTYQRPGQVDIWRYRLQ